MNIPEFMNIAPGGLEKIDAPAMEFYRLFDVAVELADKKQYDAAVPAWKQALALAPEDPRGHNNLGVALVATGKFDERSWSTGNRWNSIRQVHRLTIIWEARWRRWDGWMKRCRSSRSRWS